MAAVKTKNPMVVAKEAAAADGDGGQRIVSVLAAAVVE